MRTDGDWEAWLAFFVCGVRETAEQAVDAAQRLAKLFQDDREKIGKLGRIAGSALRVHYSLQQHPIQTANSAKQCTGLTIPTITAALKSLEKLGIVRELTGKRRNRVFAYDRYVRVLEEGTTSPPKR